MELVTINLDLDHFTQADSVASNLYDPQSLNRYAYVRNNPIKYIDPTGNEWWKPSTWTWLDHLITMFSSSNKKQKVTTPSSNVGTSQANQNSNIDQTDQLLIAEKNIDKYRTDKRYAQYSNNCKSFLNEVHKDEKGVPLPGLCANKDCTEFNYYAQGNINDVSAGDYIQRFGNIPHTAKVLTVDKDDNQITSITVLDANYQGKGMDARYKD